MNEIPFNCMVFKSFSPFSFSAMYVDTIDYAADNLLSDRNVHIRIKEEMSRPDDKYVLVFCRVKKKDIESFADAMLELQKKMLIFGNYDYESYCNNLFNMIDEKEKEKKK